MRVLLFIAVLISMIGIPETARALTAEEYQKTADRLRESQTRTNQMVQRMMQEAGLSSESATASEGAKGEPNKSKALYQIQGDLTELRIPVGKILYGRTLNRLVVGSEPSPVLITLSSDQGTYSELRMMGLARQSATPGRVSLELGQILMRTGKAIPIQASGLDEWGAMGLEAQVFSGKALAAAGAMASSFISGLAATEQAQTVNAFGYSQVQPSGRNAILGGLAQTAADQSKQLLNEETQEKPILTVEPDAPVSVLVQQEVRY